MEGLVTAAHTLLVVSTALGRSHLISLRCLKGPNLKFLGSSVYQNRDVPQLELNGFCKGR